MPMNELQRASSPDDLPSPNAALVLLRQYVQAHLRTCSPKKADALMRELQAISEEEEAAAHVLPMKASPRAHAHARARREAAALFRESLPVFMAWRRRI